MAWEPKPDDQGRLYPNYTIEIQRVATGEIRQIPWDSPWHSSSDFWWVDGNGACDCNRALFFMRDKGEIGPDDDADVSCGDSAYRVIRAIFPDGTEQAIDD